MMLSVFVKNELTELTYAEVEQFIEKLKQYQVKV